jgi:hypothetical protein
MSLIHVLEFNCYFFSGIRTTRHRTPTTLRHELQHSRKIEVSIIIFNLTPTSSAGPKSTLTKNMGVKRPDQNLVFRPRTFFRSDASSDKLDDDDEAEMTAARRCSTIRYDQRKG